MADDNSRIPSAAYKLLSPGFEVVACALNGKQAVEAVLRLQPDVVILYVLMGELAGIQAARNPLKLGSTPKVVFLMGIEDPEYASAAFELGGVGYVYKSSLDMDLARVMIAVLEGQTFCSEKRPDPGRAES